MTQEEKIKMIKDSQSVMDCVSDVKLYEEGELYQILKDGITYFIVFLSDDELRNHVKDFPKTRQYGYTFMGRLSEENPAIMIKRYEYETDHDLKNWFIKDSAKKIIKLAMEYKEEKETIKKPYTNNDYDNPQY